MLSASHRMRRSSDFGAVVRGGRRAGTRTVAVHVLDGDREGSTLVGFLVSKAVGGAVVRNRTKRRLRALMRSLIPSLAGGTRVVVRANQAAAAAPTAVLGRDLVSALRRAGALRNTPVETGPVRTEPVETGPVETGPVASDLLRTPEDVR